MPIARSAVLSPDDGPVQTIASLGVAVTVIVVIDVVLVRPPPPCPPPHRHLPCIVVVLGPRHGIPHANECTS
jgi:hypothetical protein